MGYEMKRGTTPRYMDLGSECAKCGAMATNCPECKSPMKDKDPKSGLTDLTGRPTKFDKDVPFSVQGQKPKTPPMEGAFTNKEMNEFDDKDLDRKEDAAGL
tara:strand:- start:26 stop:328 length:303 start_codon:yes stop_codon:yes gene_type:complete